MYYESNWIDSFPKNYQWSNATLITKRMAPTGSVALDEIDEVVQRLHQRAGEPHAWWEEWCAMAERMEKAADEAAAKGHQATGGNYYLRAGKYYYTGERMVPPGKQKLGIYHKSLRCAQAGLKRRYPNLDMVDVPYEKSALAAYFLKSPHARGLAPTVVLFNGLDNCKEMNVLFAGLELAFRGFCVVPSAATRSWSRSRVSEGVSAHPAGHGAWPRRRPTWSIRSSRAYRSGNGCCRSRFRYASSSPHIRTCSRHCCVSCTGSSRDFW